MSGGDQHDAPVDSNEQQLQTAVDPGRRELVKWAWRLPVIAALGGAGYGVYEAARVHFLKPAASDDPQFEDRPASRVAELSAFSSEWSSHDFELAGAPSLPAVAIRLPQSIPGGLTLSNPVGVDVAHFAAFTRICTHQHCIVSFSTDVEAINFAFNYQGRHPALTCPCHLSVFDPLRAGRAVSGPAVHPLPRVRLKVIGTELVADGIERA
ncbi:MAG: Rieske 2Fe-2S domain-containing protein [Trueperaceae bacterium]|nr:Rieske 2Fe-2S domain-containing protein [Trueperaceae bacterium]